MRRSSPVQQWLDSLPVETEAQVDKPVDAEADTKDVTVATNESDQTISTTDTTVAEKTITEKTVTNVPNQDDQNLDVPIAKELCNRKSVESGTPNNVLTSSPRGKNKNKLQRDHSVQSEGYSPKLKNPLFRDYSLQSDASGSSGSSVLNVLGARKVDAESVLLALGFGPSEKQQKLQRIPDRFLNPSKLTGISTEQFIKEEQHSMKMHDCGVFGYRGLTGNPHVPPSTIVAKIMDCILRDEETREAAMLKARHSIADMRSLPDSIIPHRYSFNN